MKPNSQNGEQASAQLNTPAEPSTAGTVTVKQLRVMLDILPDDMLVFNGIDLKPIRGVTFDVQKNVAYL
jgi:hypothetical protein